ncbi:MAG: hypothetical protein MUF34_11595 [Polyangiaceae bacterium]|nr:hypothetical protein [Polyangiaceae bacterium]
MKAAQAAVKAKGTYFKDRFQRLQARRGVKRALLAIAQELLRCAYRLLRDRVNYRELGDGYLDQLDQRGTARRLQQRLEKLGFKVTLTPKAAYELASQPSERPSGRSFIAVDGAVTRAARGESAAEDIDGTGLVVRADNGGPMKGSKMLATMPRLGVVPSFSGRA